MATWHRGVERSHSWSSAQIRCQSQISAVRDWPTTPSITYQSSPGLVDNTIHHIPKQSGIGRQHHPSHIKAVRDWSTTPSITYQSSPGLADNTIHHISKQSGIGRQHHPSHTQAVRDWLTEMSIINSTYRS